MYPKFRRFYVKDDLLSYGLELRLPDRGHVADAFTNSQHSQLTHALYNFTGVHSGFKYFTERSHTSPHKLHTELQTELHTEFYSCSQCPRGI